MLGQFRKWGVNSQDKLLVKSIWTVFHGLLCSWNFSACENRNFQEISFSAFNFEQENLKVNNFIKLKCPWWKLSNMHWTSVYIKKKKNKGSKPCEQLIADLCLILYKYFTVLLTQNLSITCQTLCHYWASLDKRNTFQIFFPPFIKRRCSIIINQPFVEN